MPINQGPDDENDALCFLIFVCLIFFLLHVLSSYFESERCPACNDQQDDDDARQLHLHSSATSVFRLLLDGAVPVTQTAFPRCKATLRRCARKENERGSACS